MKRILIIPDVHGRDFWKEPVKQELKNNETSIIFLGDYTDCYPVEIISSTQLTTSRKSLN